MPKEEGFEAPDWVSNDSATPPLTVKQKRILNISLFVVVVVVVAVVVFFSFFLLLFYCSN